MFLGMAGAKFYRFALRVLRLSDDKPEYVGRGAPDGAGDYTGDVGDAKADNNERARMNTSKPATAEITADKSPQVETAERL